MLEPGSLPESDRAFVIPNDPDSRPLSWRSLNVIFCFAQMRTSYHEPPKGTISTEGWDHNGHDIHALNAGSYSKGAARRLAAFLRNSGETVSYQIAMDEGLAVDADPCDTRIVVQFMMHAIGWLEHGAQTGGVTVAERPIEAIDGAAWPPQLPGAA